MIIIYFTKGDPYASENDAFELFHQARNLYK
jgi:hypothetical protein